MKKKKFHKLTHWEYWNTWFFYIPNIPYGLYLVAKARHLAFYTAANPSIKNAGIGTESKYETLELVPKKYKPKSVLHTSNTLFLDTLNALKRQKIEYPIIAKPDIGFRGLLVEKLYSEQELKEYLNAYKVDIIIQEFIDYENECGVFYFRNPSEKTGEITSLTLKEFLSVIGDGISTLERLILKDERAKLYTKMLFKLHQKNLQSIPKNNEKIKLSVIGNHSKGTQFLYGNHLISDQLIQTFDALSHDIPGWFYGRMDLKYNSFNEVENGSDFKVLEINGIMAEPTHMYDSKRFTYFQALKAIRKHWKIIYTISITNHKKYDVPYKNTLTFIGEIRALKRYTKKVTGISKN